MISFIFAENCFARKTFFLISIVLQRVKGEEFGLMQNKSLAANKKDKGFADSDIASQPIMSTSRMQCDDTMNCVMGPRSADVQCAPCQPTAVTQFNIYTRTGCIVC